VDLEDLNDSELASVAQDIDPEAHRGLSRSTLTQLIEHGEEPVLPERGVNKVRLKIMQFILDHWTQVAPLLSCPASTKNPRACFTCTDVQVFECALINKKTLFTTTVPDTEETKEIEDMSNLPEGFVPRSRSEWEELSRSTDPMTRGKVIGALRLLKVQPGQYVHWKEDQRIDFIMKAQEEAGVGGSKEKPAATGKPKAAATATPTATATATATATPSAEKTSGGGSADTKALEKKIADLQGQVLELSKLAAEQGQFIKETHYLFRVFVFGNAELGTNAQDEGIREEFFGKLFLGNE
jgi:hypothetical protein